MSWFVEGNGEHLQIGILDSGLPSVWGEAIRHEPKPAGGDGDFKFYQRLGSADCSWSIHPTNETELYLDDFGTGFYKKIQQNPDRALASIEFHDDPNLIGITIALPPQTFKYAMELFQNVLVHQNMSYLITMDFLGFKVPEANTETPTVREFLAGSLDGKAYVSEEVSFLIKRSVGNA